MKTITQPKYPRVCAHRGISKTMPENTLVAFAAAIQIGADEIEFDVKLTKDRHMVLMHDNNVDRTTNGSGNVWELTLAQLKSLSVGANIGEGWENIEIPTIDEVFESFANKIHMNIHIRQIGDDDTIVRYVYSLIQKYNAHDFCAFSGEENVLASAIKIAPDVKRNCLDHKEDPGQVETAIKYKCAQVQFFRHVTDEEIKKAKQHGIICNLFYSDDLKDAKEYVSRGIDTILSNYANRMVGKI